MSLDLDEIMLDWCCPPGEISARSLCGADGGEVLQLRIELGMLQMFPDGRPDGGRYRGLPTALEFVAHEQRIGGDPSEQDVRELEREVTQYNYRRLALSTIADEALKEDDKEEAVRQLLRAIRDTEQCLKRVRLIDELRERSPEQVGLKPTLMFNRARLASQLRVVQGRFEDAIQEADRGASTLEEFFAEIGIDVEQCEEDPGVQFLRQLAERLRKQYGIQLTLRERLDEAIENEDFEAAARLREELRRRREPPRDFDDIEYEE